MDVGNRKFTIIGISVVLLMTAAIGADGAVKIYSNSSEKKHKVITMSNKAVDSLCQHTDYKISCRKSLASANNTNDPKELVKMALNSAIMEIEHAINKSSTLRAAAEDPRAAQALEMCKSLLNTSIDDIKRSLRKLDDFDTAKMEEYLADVKVWLSGSLTYQETCREGFENTTGDSGEKMKKILDLGGKLTSNGLAMVAEVRLTGNSHRLLEKNLNDESYPWWASRHRRLLLEAHDLESLKPNAIVAQDHSGTFRTIMDAVRTVPEMNTQPFVILIKKGIYREYVEIPRRVNNVVFIGEGQKRTRITGNKSYDDGYATFYTATVEVNGDGFMATGIRFENTAGPEKHQAVALRVSGDMAIIHDCAMHGYQDTLYAHAYRQFYRKCTVTGTVDFVFGNGAAVFQDCKMIVRKPIYNECVVTAQGRKHRRSPSGLVLHNCTITGDRDYFAANPRPKTYLGRPWKLYSRTIVMQSFIDGIIAPEGWAPWAGTFGLDTCYYGEFENRGPGANTAKRVKWKGVRKISREEADSYTPGKYIQADLWIKATGVPYTSGIMKHV